MLDAATDVMGNIVDATIPIRTETPPLHFLVPLPAVHVVLAGGSK